MAMKMPASPVDPATATRTRRRDESTVGVLGTGEGGRTGTMEPGTAALVCGLPEPEQPVRPNSAPAPSSRPASRMAARRPIVRSARPHHLLYFSATDFCSHQNAP